MNVQLEGDDIVKAQEACGTSVVTSTPTVSIGLSVWRSATDEFFGFVD